VRNDKKKKVISSEGETAVQLPITEKMQPEIKGERCVAAFTGKKGLITQTLSKSKKKKVLNSIAT